jgi:hypothetical protein
MPTAVPFFTKSQNALRYYPVLVPSWTTSVHPGIQANQWVPDPFSQISIKQAYHYFLVASGICCGAAVRYREIVFIHRLHPS